MAKLFIVPKEPVEQNEPEEIENEAFEISGDAEADIETALRAIAFLIEWGEGLGPASLKQYADRLNAYREGRHD